MHLKIVISFLFLLFSPGLLAAEGKLLYYILDGSGSMWGRAEGKIKIEVAKDVLSQLIADMPDDLQSGLTVYGHRKKGDCGDIEELIAPGLIDRASAISSIKKISPKGKTPIGDSIQKTIEMVKANEATTTIVLVSDGIETCDSDPCALTKSLSESGVKFKMHVVGFGVGDSDAEQLSCIAEAGGGRYFSAVNSKSLLDALQVVEKSVVTEEKIVIPPIVETVALEPEVEKIVQNVKSTSKSIKIKAAGPGRIALKAPSWLNAPYYWKLIDPESGLEKGRYKGMAEQLVPVGDYQIVWRQVQHGSDEVQLGEVVTVKSGKTTEVPLYTAVQVNVPGWVEKPYYYRFNDPLGNINDKVAQFKSMEPQLVPPGTYQLFWKQNQHDSRVVDLGSVTIKPDELNVVNLKTSINLLPAEWVSKDLNYWELRHAGDNKLAAKFYKKFSPQLVAPGRYNIFYSMHQHKSTESHLGEIEVKEGVLNEFSVNTGVKLSSSSETKPPYRIEFVDLDTEKTTRLRDSWGPMALQPGRYKINYHQDQHKSKRITIVEEFELPPGNLVEIDL